MGKKSRLKRERRDKKSNFLEKIIGVHGTGVHDSNSDFQRRASQLRDLFSKYNAEDVAIALGVSDLWLPNIASQVKHHFALGVFATMQIEQFSSSNRLGTYGEFCNFIQIIHATLPSFPGLEDFIPEPDWGEVRVACRGTFLKIFYGSNVERIPDFIEAFRILHEGHVAAFNDMDCVVALQNRLISNINKEVIGCTDEIVPGHVETPSEAFWMQCSAALLSACDVLSEFEEVISSALVLNLGNFKKPSTWSSFGDSVMNGTSLPAVIISVGGKRFPLSLRNATSVVIDLWGGRAFPSTTNANLSRSVANFLSQRIEEGALISGPLALVSRKIHLPYRFAAVISTSQLFYFVLVLDIDAFPMLSQIEQDIHALIASGEEWSILIEEKHEAIQFQRKDGAQPGVADIRIHAVLSRVETSWLNLPIPDTKAHVMSLPDFVTVFDTLENADELDRFWTYVENHESLISPMCAGPADLFGSFRDSNELLVEGAIVPTMISLDPHWGSNWRYRVLTEFWAAAPPLFPDDTLSWKVELKSDGLQRLIAKGRPALAWCTIVNDCTVFVIFQIYNKTLDLHNGRMLELFVHCLADALSQRCPLLEGYPLFSRKRINLECRACTTTLATVMDDENTKLNANMPLLSGWQLHGDQDAQNISATVEVNIARLQSRLNSPSDASFEVECVSQGLAGLSSLAGIVLSEELALKLNATSSRKPRFTLKRINRTVDVPDFSSVNVPTAGQYKIARRDLAVVLKTMGAKPGSYELAEAKAIIDPARNEMRTQIHNKIVSFDRQALLLNCIEQYDALTTKYQREVFRVTQSLEHEVSFDRSEALAEAHESFVREARNYRYLLECCVSAPVTGSALVTTQEVVQLVATIDWLLVLYGASDVLHNDIEVAGVEIDDSFIPKVYYSKDREEREKAFALEVADAKLGIDLLHEDEVASAQEAGKDWGVLDQAFVADLGFSLTHLTQTFLVLARWQAMGGEAELRLSYQASVSKIIDMLERAIPGLNDDEAARLVNFVTLNPAKIRRLAGKFVDESDVPVWEHNKREHRYTIRPLITIDKGLLTWGAAAVDRAASIWTGSISNGYLPAEFGWRHVKPVVRDIKVGIEKQLEVRAFEVCSRATPCLQHGIDFKNNFPDEGFEDVGDFDVLAYWPETNQWLCVECKYNQPPFCLKDARRLRERIFGSGSDRGQFSKIERRRGFLTSQVDHLRAILRWPEPAPGKAPIFTEVYVSRDIYWWMRNPPFEVPTQFVRIDGLDRWLREQGFSVLH